MFSLEEFKIGIYEEAFFKLKLAVAQNNFVVTILALVDFIEFLRDNEFDCHIAIDGANGLGKSTAAMLLLKYLGGWKTDDIIFPFNSYRDFINKLTMNERTNIWCDELGHFFNYKVSMTKEQIGLFSAIEVARSHCNLLVGCCRDVRRLNNNYRNGKISIVIRLLDRFKQPNPGAYGVVLIGEPFVEIEDRFYLNLLSPSHELKTLRAQFERLPSFLGYIFFDDATKELDKNLIAEYKREKERGVQHLANYHMQRIGNKQIQSDLESFEEVME